MDRHRAKNIREIRSPYESLHNNRPTNSCKHVSRRRRVSDQGLLGIGSITHGGGGGMTAMVFFGR